MFPARLLLLSGQVSADGMDGTPAKWKYCQSIGLQSLRENFIPPEAFYGNL
jgi:hypothetical protein